MTLLVCKLGPGLHLHTPSITQLNGSLQKFNFAVQGVVGTPGKLV